MITCQKSVNKFIDEIKRRDQPVLLAFSGGSDSLALFLSLHEERERKPFSLHLAHIDHGWREESSMQAESLKKLAEELGYPFHLCRLEPPQEKTNLEEKARLERFAFFKKVYREIGAQCLLLAHQAEDLAETVLKRICEGASLLNLQGMEEIGEIEEMKIYRPFLKVSKKEILSFLETQSVQPIDDETNRDTYFLRARMRERIFPLFNETFGKETTGNFVRFSGHIKELKEYFERKMERYLETRQEQEGLVSYNLQPLFPLEKLEVSIFLTEVAKKENVFLSRQQKEIAADHLYQKSENKIIANKDKMILVHKGVLQIKTTF